MVRRYDSPAREEAKQETRDRILDAMVEVVTRDGVHAFTVQNVADAAGVAHRTVYRHFASREDLLDGLDDLLERRSEELGIIAEARELEADDLPELVKRAYASFTPLEDAMRAYVVISIALGRRVPSFERRTRAFKDAIARRFPRLTQEEVDGAASVIRLLASSRSWYLLTTDHDLSTEAAASAVSTSVAALLAELDARSSGRTP